MTKKTTIDLDEIDNSNVYYMVDYRQRWVYCNAECGSCGHKWVLVGHISSYRDFNACNKCKYSGPLTKYGKIHPANN